MVSLQTLCQQHHIWYIRRIPSTKGSLAKKISRVFCALQCQTGIISHLLPRSAAQGDDTVFAVGARIARPPREAVFRDGKGVAQGRFLRRTKGSLCKGPARERRLWRMRRPKASPWCPRGGVMASAMTEEIRVSGHCRSYAHPSAVRPRQFTTPPALRATSPYTGEGRLQ